MKMKLSMSYYFLSIIGLFISPFAMEAQNFEAAYGDVDNEVAGAAIYTKDGGTLLVGYTSSFGIGSANFDLYVVKTDVNGIIQWQKTYSQTGNQH